MKIIVVVRLRPCWIIIDRIFSGLEQHISGVILYDETFWQKTDDDQLFVDVLRKKGIVVGIKLDKVLCFISTGATDLTNFSVGR